MLFFRRSEVYFVHYNYDQLIELHIYKVRPSCICATCHNQALWVNWVVAGNHSALNGLSITVQYLQSNSCCILEYRKVSDAEIIVNWTENMNTFGIAWLLYTKCINTETWTWVWVIANLYRYIIGNYQIIWIIVLYLFLTCAYIYLCISISEFMWSLGININLLDVALYICDVTSIWVMSF